MKFEIDTDKLIENTITIQNYLFLQTVYQQDDKFQKIYRDQIGEFFNKNDIEFLMSIDLLKFINEEKGYFLSNLKVTDRFIDVFLEDPPVLKSAKGSETVEGWIDEWYELFPKGVRSGSYPIKSGKKGCLIKLKKFVKEYPEFNKDIIIKATKDYIRHSAMNNYKFMQLADYFIYKNNKSTLASSCELIMSKIEEGKSFDDINSGNGFNKSLN